MQLEQEHKELRERENSEKLKSLRIELQRTEEAQLRQRIKQETAKVYHGTVIHRCKTALDQEGKLESTIKMAPLWTVSIWNSNYLR